MSIMDNPYRNCIVLNLLVVRVLVCIAQAHCVYLYCEVARHWPINHSLSTNTFLISAKNRGGRYLLDGTQYLSETVRDAEQVLC